MKKKIAIAVVIAGLGMAGLNQAYAGWGGRSGGGQYANCPQVRGGQFSQVDPAVREKRDAFFDATLELRKEMAMKQAEKQALMRSDNPDPAAMSKVAGELFDLRTALRQKGDEAGISELMGPMGGRDFGPGKGGPGKGGRNMGYMMDYPGSGAGRF